MKAFLISYDLKAPNRNYEGLITQIKTMGDWWHYLDSTWIIKTDKSLTTIQQILNAQIDANDSILIIEVRSNSGGWLPKDAWDWIATNVPP